MKAIFCACVAVLVPWIGGNDPQTVKEIVGRRASDRLPYKEVESGDGKVECYIDSNAAWIKSECLKRREWEVQTDHSSWVAHHPISRNLLRPLDNEMRTKVERVCPCGDGQRGNESEYFYVEGQGIVRVTWEILNERDWVRAENYFQYVELFGK